MIHIILRGNYARKRAIRVLGHSRTHRFLRDTMASMSERVNISKQDSAICQTLLEMNTAASESAAAAGLGPRLIELIRTGASQINGCSFCLRMHTRGSLNRGCTPEAHSTTANPPIVWPCCPPGGRAAISRGRAGARGTGADGVSDQRQRQAGRPIMNCMSGSSRFWTPPRFRQ